MKVNVKFANGNGMAFLGQGYITSDDKKMSSVMAQCSSLIESSYSIKQSATIGINSWHSQRLRLR